jgi:hypothetical protein
MESVKTREPLPHIRLIDLFFDKVREFGEHGKKEEALQLFNTAVYVFDLSDIIRTLSKIHGLMTSAKGGSEQNKEDFEFHLGHFCLRIYSVREKFNQILNMLILDVSPDNKDLHDEIRRNKKTKGFPPILKPFDESVEIKAFLKMRRLLTHQTYEFFQRFPEMTVLKLAKTLNRDPKEIETDLTQVQMTRYLREASGAINTCSTTFENISEKLNGYIQVEFVLPRVAPPQKKEQISERTEALKRVELKTFPPTGN